MSVENRSEYSDLLKRPIILIGAGRSGSTLFARMLNAHPDIQFLGETGFVIPRVWREVWDNRFWLNFQYYVMREPTSSREPPVDIPAEAMDAAKQRAARGVRMLFAEFMQVDARFSAWGFKEIWNGNPGVAQIPWSVHQTIFPHARWVHLVRDPFAFVQSSVRWDQLPLTTDRLTGQLKKWQQIVEWSRQLANGPDFHEIRYEDLVSDPKTTLAPVLTSVGLDWNDECGRELGRYIIASEHQQSSSKTKTLSQTQIDRIVESVTDLRISMQTLRYELPTQVTVAESRRFFLSQENLRPRIDLRTMRPRYGSGGDKWGRFGKRLREVAKKLTAVRTSLTFR